MPSVSSLHLSPQPLRTPAFTRLLLSRTVTRLGSALTTTALLLQVAGLTRSPLATGGVAAVQLVPVLVLGLYGGHLADRFDRRRIAVIAELSLLGLSLVLVAASMLPRPPLTLMYVVVAASSAFSSAQRAALDSAVPRVTPRDQLPAASAWLSAGSALASLGGPALGGLVYYTASATACYALDCVSFGLSALCLFGLPTLQPPSREHPLPVLRSLAEGLAYVQRRPDLRGSYLLDLVVMALASPLTLLPFLAADLGSSGGSGILFSATAAGALMMTALSGWTGRITRIGLPLAAACRLYATTTILLASCTTLPTATLLLAIAGAADILSVIFRDTLWNSTIPDHLRGRVAGVETVSYAIGTPISGLVMGTLGQHLGFRTALTTGGAAALVLVALIAVLTPSLRRATTPDHHDEADSA